MSRPLSPIERMSYLEAFRMDLAEYELIKQMAAER